MKLITDLNDRALYQRLRTDDELRSACNQNCNQGRMCDCVPAVDEPGTHTALSDIANVAAIVGGFLAEQVCRPRVVFALIGASLIGLHAWRAGWIQ